MYSKLPKYILRKKFKNLFLFFDSEIYYRELFNKNIQEFSDKTGGKEVIVEVMNFKLFEEYKKYSIIKIPNTNKKSLEILEEIPLIDDKFVGDLLGDYYIYDDTKEWEFFVSILDEVAVFGCNDDILPIFMDIFQPYKEDTLEDKLRMIYGCCSSEKNRKKFIEKLCANYKFPLAPIFNRRVNCLVLKKVYKLILNFWYKSFFYLSLRHNKKS